MIRTQKSQRTVDLPADMRNFYTTMFLLSDNTIKYRSKLIDFLLS